MLEAIHRWENEGGALPSDGRQPMRTIYRGGPEAQILPAGNERRSAPPDRTAATLGTCREGDRGTPAGSAGRADQWMREIT
jgi:hypothetical protein